MMPHADSASLLVITGCYLIFACQFVVQTKWKRVDIRSATAIGLLIAVFVLCGLSGYATALLDSSWWVVREVMHLILAGVSAVMVLTNRAKVLSEAVEKRK